MAPKLRISAGPDVDHLEIVNVNHDNEPFVVDSERFHGRLTVRIKDFVGESPDGTPANKTTAYFQEPYGDSMTYSIQVQGTSSLNAGQFSSEISVNDLVFGNEFDRPIRVC